MSKEPMSKCEVCNKNYRKKVFWQKYCSKECKMHAFVLRKAEELLKKKK
jgi:hypothetical protein